MNKNKYILITNKLCYKDCIFYNYKYTNNTEKYDIILLYEAYNIKKSLSILIYSACSKFFKKNHYDGCYNFKELYYYKITLLNKIPCFIINLDEITIKNCEIYTHFFKYIEKKKKSIIFLTSEKLAKNNLFILSYILNKPYELSIKFLQRNTLYLKEFSRQYHHRYKILRMI